MTEVAIMIYTLCLDVQLVVGKVFVEPLVISLKMIDDQMDELFQQLLEDGYTVEQAADLAYNEING